MTIMPFRFGAGIAAELAKMYKNSKAGFREMCANSLDQYEHEDCKDAEKEITIRLSRLRATVKCEDGATGIEKGKKEAFKTVGTDDITGETGKVVGNQISSYKHIHTKVIGNKHVGKLSYVNMCKDPINDHITFYSNNGYNGEILKMVGLQGWDEPDEIVDTTKALPHRGLKFIIENVQEGLLKPKTAVDCLSDWFGIRIARKEAKIVVIDEDDNNKVYIVPKPENLDTHEYFDKDVLVMASGIPISHNLKHVDKKQKRGIDIYVKHIKVCTIPVPFLASGWVNCDELVLTISREGYIDNPEFDDRLIRFFIKNGFAREEESTEPKMKDQKQLEELLGEVAQIYSQEFKDEFVDIIGDPDPKGVRGIAVKGRAGKTDWELYKTDQKIVRGAGDPEGEEEITTHGDKHKRKVKGPKITIPPVPPKVPGPGPGIEDGGNRTAFIRRNIETNKKTDNVKPRCPLDEIPRGDMPILFIENDIVRGIRAVLNTDRRAYKIIKMSGGPKQKDIVLPHFVRAMVRYQTRNMDLSIEEYENRCDTVLSRFWEQ